MEADDIKRLQDIEERFQREVADRLWRMGIDRNGEFACQYATRLAGVALKIRDDLKRWCGPDYQQLADLERALRGL